MISIKSPREIETMKKAGRITGGALKHAGEVVRAGMTTYELDKIINRYIVSHGAKPSCLGYGGFPGSACISVNDEVIHGIPGPRKLKSGDVVSVDLGAYIDGFHGDSAKTFIIGDVSDEVKALLKSTEESLYKAIEIARIGTRLGDIGHTVQKYNEDNGYSVVREFVGHGVGRDLHEDPEIPNYGKEGRGPRLVEGMVIAIEPMINLGTEKVYVMPDEWTVRTRDGKPSAHFEHTIAITKDGPIILTDPDIE
ncbi:MAG: type I methionyl aminopeptidase [Ruminococcus sp.]|nr:type I methionyl aminopeptidase [Ruminococcus sp.]